jgi:hypothetical protein
MKADIRSCHFHLLGVPVLSLDAVWEPSGTRRLRATRHVEHRTLSQSRVSRPENRQGRDASGVVFRENIWTCRLPICT